MLVKQGPVLSEANLTGMTLQSEMFYLGCIIYLKKAILDCLVYEL